MAQPHSNIGQNYRKTEDLQEKYINALEVSIENTIFAPANS